MGRHRWGAATDTSDPLSLVQVLLNEWSCPLVGEYEDTPLMASLSFLATFCFLAATESSVVVIMRLTAPICAAAAVFVEVFIRGRGPSVCLPSFAFSPNVSHQQSERGGAERAPRTCRRPPLDNLLSVPLAAVSRPPPQPPQTPTLRYCRGTSSETTWVSPYFFL